ncbi:hypothetical protein J2W30_000753 [Variovorax boronicumulans]|uniref:DUF3606 domain-containing protein n=1 Tax=Variovorax TaxID=34072 RepID=UPI00278448E5|nr:MULTISPECIES: DUF3606 domain-containing protein [Variovorax]MDQ0033012.1 hypothetical protein [Variovorax boronicumulans]MDQ0609146.1 hypothetical protein [Variovorax sp. W1I1]
MANNPTTSTQGNDASAATLRIDRGDTSQVARWTREFDVTEAQLAEAIEAVGDKAADVELYLKGSRSATNADKVDDAS